MELDSELLDQNASMSFTFSLAGMASKNVRFQPLRIWIATAETGAQSCHCPKPDLAIAVSTRDARELSVCFGAFGHDRFAVSDRNGVNIIGERHRTAPFVAVVRHLAIF